MLKFLENRPPSTKNLDKLLALEQRFFLPDHNLNYTDKMSMAAGVEVRVPFLDLELVNFATSIPIKFKQKGYVGKWILKKAMEPYLPREIIYRPKSGFGVPVRKWIREDLKEMVTDLLGSKSSIIYQELFDRVEVLKLIENNRKGLLDASYTLLSVLCIELWFRHVLNANNKISS